jgi:two-component system, NarL family, response regulator DevR
MTNPSSPAIRVLLVDDSPIIRLGLRSALEDCADISIVGEAGTAASGLEMLNRLKPDVVMLDLHLPDKSGLLACRDYLKTRPGTPVMILTSSNSEQNMHDAIAAGAKGYLLKENDALTLAGALRKVAGGESVIDTSMAAKVMNLVKHGGSQSAASKLNCLSSQERRVVALLAGGMTNKEIGDQLSLTEKTVKNYLANIFSKLNITRRTQAAALYVEAGKV